VYQNPKLVQALVDERVAQLRSAKPAARGERPNVVRRAGWLLVDIGLWLAVPRTGAKRRRRRTLIAE
jgi:hypothetical protein